MFKDPNSVTGEMVDMLTLATKGIKPPLTLKQVAKIYNKASAIQDKVFFGEQEIETPDDMLSIVSKEVKKLIL